MSKISGQLLISGQF